MKSRVVSACILIITLLGSGAAFSTQTIPFGFFRNASFLANKLAFTTSAQTINAGDCSGITTVQTQNASGVPLNVGSNLTVSLTAATGLSYYSDAMCTTEVTAITVLSGASTASFYFVSDVSGTQTTTVTATNYNDGAQTHTINANAFIWTGGGGDANWTTGTNWSGGAAPSTTSHTAYFLKSCASNCSPTIDTNISIKGVRINAGYTGTITQPTTRTITLAGDGWLQKAGTFAGGDSAITINGSTFSVLGGTFTSTTNTLLLVTVQTTSTTSYTIFTVSGSGAFASNSGTVQLNGKSNWSTSPLFVIDVPDFFEFNHLILHQGMAYNSNSAAYQPVSGRTIVIKGNLTHGTSQYASGSGMSRIDGLWNLEGNMTIGSDAVGGTVGATGVVTLTGTGAQTVTGDTNGYTTDLAINKASGAVTVGSANLRVRRFLLDQGTFTAPTGLLETYYYRPSGSSTTTILRIAAGTTFNTNSGTVKLAAFANWSTNPVLELDVPDLFAFNNLILGQGATKNSNSITYRAISSRTVITNGNFSHGGSDFAAAGGATKVDGSWQVKGNYTVGTDSFGGTSAVTLNGTGAQSITVGAGATMPSGNFVVNKASGTATLTTAASFNTAAQTVTVTAGILDMAGFNLTVNSTISVAAGAKLLCNGGLLAAGSYNMLGEVSCGPSAGISWTGTAGDNLWNTAGNWTNGTVPGASDVAVFNGMCTGANCNATMPATLSIKGATLQSTYLGTITAGATSLTLGTTGWTQAAGTFNAGSAPMTLNGPFALSGGTFTAPTNTITVNANFSVTGAPTFTTTGSTLRLVGPSTTNTISIVPGTVSYNNVDIPAVNTCTTFDLNAGTMNINGTLTVATTGWCGGLRPLNNGTMRAYGDVTFSGPGVGGSGTFSLAGNASGQTLTSVASASIPNLSIAAGANPVTLSGQINVTGNYTMTSVGTFTTTGSTLAFTGGTGATAITPGSVTYTNVSFPNANSCTTYSLGGGTMEISGLLTVATSSWCGATRQINSGTLNAKGDVSFSGSGSAGTVLIRVVGTTNQTITGVSGASIRSFEIASTGGTVTLVGTLFFTTNYLYTSGVIDAGTSTLQFYNNAATSTITPGASVIYNNVTFAGVSTTYTLVGTITVNGTLTFGDSSNPSYNINGGTMLALGNVTVSGWGYQGTALLKIGGSGNQTITGTSGAVIMATEIASTGGTVTFSGYLYFTRDYTYTSGTIAAGTSTVRFSRSSAAATITPGAGVDYNNILFAGTGATFALVGTINVNGTLTMGDGANPSYTINTGTLAARGDVVYNGWGYSGTAPLIFEGSTSKNFTAPTTGSRTAGTVTIAKTGGASVTLLTNSSFGYAGQDLTIASGVLDLGGYTLAVTDVLTIDSGATLRCNGGSFTQGTLTNNGTLNCPGQAGYEFNWTGTAADGNWNTAGNWQGGAVPGTTGIVIFDDAYCGANCSVTMNAAVNIRGVTINSGYSGTITQGAGNTVTIGSAGWTQPSGTFVGSNSNVTYNGPFALSGGTHTATSATTTTTSNWSITGAPTFNHSSGLFSIVTNGGGSQIIPSTVNYYNVQVSGGGSGSYIDFNAGTVRALGNLTVNLTGGTHSNGTIDVKGNANVTLATTTIYFNVKLSGGSNQTLTLSGTVPMGPLEIASTGGTVSTVGTLSLRGLTYTSGTMNWGTSPLSIVGGTSYNNVISPGSITYPNAVEFIGGGSNASINLSGGTMNISGPLTMANNSTNGIFNGTIVAKGDLTVTQIPSASSATLKIGGSGNQAVSLAVALLPNLEIASTGGTVSFTGDLNAYRTFTYTSGTVNWGTSAITFSCGSSLTMSIFPGSLVYPNTTFMAGGSSSNFTLNSGTLIVGGTLTFNTTVASGINTGTIEARGDVSLLNNTSTGNAALTFTGSAAQTISRTAGNWPTGTRTVNKSGGSITQASAISFTGANPLTITSGSWFMSGYALTVPNLTLNSNTLTKGTGVLTVNSVVAGTGALYGGTVAP